MGTGKRKGRGTLQGSPKTNPGRQMPGERAVDSLKHKSEKTWARWAPEGGGGQGQIGVGIWIAGPPIWLQKARFVRATI